MDRAGVYKLDVVNLHYHFEPVVVEISDLLDEELKKKRPINAFLYSLKQGKD